MTDAPRSLVERLREMAKRISYFSHGLNSDDTPIIPLAPEETLEGEAATALEALEREVAELKPLKDWLAEVKRQRDNAEAALTLAGEQVREQAAKVAEAEPELPGEPPMEIIVETMADPVRVLRANVRITKRNIAAAIRTMPLEGGE